VNPEADLLRAHLDRTQQALRRISLHARKLVCERCRLKKHIAEEDRKEHILCQRAARVMEEALAEADKALLPGKVEARTVTERDGWGHARVVGGFGDVGR